MKPDSQIPGYCLMAPIFVAICWAQYDDQQALEKEHAAISEIQRMKY